MASKSAKKNISTMVLEYLEAQAEQHPEGLPAEVIAAAIGVTKKQAQGALYLLEKQDTLLKMGQAKTVNGRVIIPYRYAVATPEERKRRQQSAIVQKQWKPQASMRDFLASLATHHG
ncbi:hypothetical protein B1757_13070 [Acidithiobacillus marinus]|uniref:Uncharacterized protein n=1 Tax=Acidithiobacillus marinus TaxID=187490 RepID=A0A2I1DIW2_9PROT|nr:hypothetical protein [Acidithiobacillus marinus]PKY09813.1 hypothetical protein B1757_13070 [Acidithiobacillus marinus]